MNSAQKQFKTDELDITRHEMEGGRVEPTQKISKEKTVNGAQKEKSDWKRSSRYHALRYHALRSQVFSSSERVQRVRNGYDVRGTNFMEPVIREGLF